MSLTRSARGLLNANWLRQRAGRLRTSHPALYARLNGMRKRVLSGGSGVEAYQANALSTFFERCPVRGRRVLEIESAAVAALISRALPPALAPGAVVLCDQELSLPGAAALALPEGVKPGRYHLYRLPA